MSEFFTKQRIIILIILVIIGIILGRLAFRAFMNMLLGGTLFGGNILWLRKDVKEACLLFYV